MSDIRIAEVLGINARSRSQKTVRELGREASANPLRCPSCNEPGAVVIDSRPTRDDQVMRRRRGCAACNTRWTTYEVPAETIFTHAPEGYADLGDDDRRLVAALIARLARADDETPEPPHA